MPKPKKNKQGSKIRGLPYTSDITEISIKLGLLSSERLLLHSLRAKMNKKQRDKVAFPMQVTLGREMGLSERQVRRLIDSLVEYELISMKKRNIGKRYGNNLNEYRFNFPWKPNKKPKSNRKPSSGMKSKRSKSNRTSVSGVKPDICDTSNRTSATVKPDMGVLSNRTPVSSQNKQGNKPKNKSSLLKQKKDDNDDFSENILQTQQNTPKLSEKEKEEKWLLSAIERKYPDCDNVAEQAKDFADKDAKKRGIDNTLPYRNEIYGSILRGERKDFEPITEKEKEEISAQTIILREDDPAIEKEKAKQKKKQAEQKKKQQAEKKRKLSKLYQDLISDDGYVDQCIDHLGLINPKTNKIDLENFEAFILECGKSGKLKGKKTLIEDLRNAIIEEAE